MQGLPHKAVWRLGSSAVELAGTQNDANKSASNHALLHLLRAEVEHWWESNLQTLRQLSSQSSVFSLKPLRTLLASMRPQSTPPLPHLKQIQPTHTVLHCVSHRISHRISQLSHVRRNWQIEAWRAHPQRSAHESSPGPVRQPGELFQMFLPKAAVAK